MYKNRNFVLLLGGLAGLAVIVACVAARETRTTETATIKAASNPDQAVLASSGEGNAKQPGPVRIAEEWGIEPFGVTLTAAGYMLDFRYRVTDPQKALTFMERGAKACLINQETGTKTFVPNPPKVGPMRQTSRQPSTDRTYFVFFANPGRFIKAGDKVTVAIGDCRIEDLVVVGPRAEGRGTRAEEGV